MNRIEEVQQEKGETFIYTNAVDQDNYSLIDAIKGLSEWTFSTRIKGFALAVSQVQTAAKIYLVDNTGNEIGRDIPTVLHNY